MPLPKYQCLRTPKEKRQTTPCLLISANTECGPSTNRNFCSSKILVFIFHTRSKNYGMPLLASSCLYRFPSVRPFIRPHGTTRLSLDGFSWHLCIFRKLVEKTQVSLKSDKNNGYFTWRHKHIYDNILLDYSWNKKYFRQKL